MHSNEQIESIISNKRQHRRAMIESLIVNNDNKDYDYWMMHYDFEKAPWTTDRTRLSEFGIDFPVSFESCREELLDDILKGYEYLGIKFCNHEHLSREELLRFILESGLLDEVIRDIPPDTTHKEYIDLSETTVLLQG